jgi:GDP-L-fucose synthase
MPCNLYGENDNWENDDSHVIPALIRKIHQGKVEGKNVEIWGTGKPLREFLHVQDLAEAIHLTLERETPNILNVGSEEEINIYDLSVLISKIIGFRGSLKFNGKMDGAPRKIMDSSKIRELGWKPKITLEEGLIEVYEYYKNIS